MIKLENYEVMGWEHAIRGMRNPMNSWEKSDSELGCDAATGSHRFCRECEYALDMPSTHIACGRFDTPSFIIGPNDLSLMKKLSNAGPVHGKFKRMITVYVDITAPALLVEGV